jgi:signal peptidase I
MRNWVKQNKAFLLFAFCLGVFRTAVADWNPIPSGSMRPNLLEGDVVLVNRLAYDLKLPLTDFIVVRVSDPRRGDIVTFSSPKDGTRLIKRLVALPGDRVEMRDQQLIINGQPAHYSQAKSLREDGFEALCATESTADHQRRIQWLAGMQAPRSFGPLTVPTGHYLMLGDNRDNSADSRYFGFVPRGKLIGRAHHILVSADIRGDWLPRLERIGQSLR